MDDIDIALTAESPDFLPHYATEEAAGADLKAAVEASVILQPGDYSLIPTGVRLHIPKGFEVQVRPRSGLALRHGVTVLNSPGTIDSDYRGEIQVIIINHGKKPFEITRGMRIAQMVLAPVSRARFARVDELSATTVRSDKGFGHTGTH